MREKIAAGNWKMNTSIERGATLAKELVQAHDTSASQMILIPPFTHLHAVNQEIKGTGIALGAQNCNENASGAYTGEVSAQMLGEIGVKYVVLGHSERRAYYGESESTLASKCDAVLAQGLSPIYCCGETKEQREANDHFDVIKNQIAGGLFHLLDEQIRNTVIAYEPVWAIGTGLTASADQAQEVHAFIRNLISEKYGAETAEMISILYGGSVKPANAAELFSCPDIDGGLVGGAALDAESFSSIASAF